MRRQASDSEYQPILPSTRSAHRSVERLDSRSNHKNVIHKVIDAKGVFAPSQNKIRQVKSKSPGKELNPLRFNSPKADSDIDLLQNYKSTKEQRIMTSASNASEQYSVEYTRNKPLTGSMERENDNPKVKRSASYKQNASLKRITQNGGTKKPLAQKVDNPSSNDKSKTDLTVAIYEQNEDDEEEDVVDSSHQPNQHFFTEEKITNPTDQSGTYNLYGFNQNNQETLKSEADPDIDSPISKQDSSFGRGRFKFRPEKIITTDMNTSRLGAGESNVSTAGKSPNNVRGVFMNEHITQNEFDIQKEKKRQMKEALDFQLNEKKRKIEEEKQRQNDFNRKEEERIRREMEQLKFQHEKEADRENLRKRSHKTEENEKLPSRQSEYKPSTSKPTEKPEKVEKQHEKLNTEGNKVESKEALGFRIPPSPVRVQRGLTSHGKENSAERKNKEGEVKTHSHMDLLLEENTKLRDENTKKEELIDVLLNVLKQKGSTPTQLTRSTLPASKPKEDSSRPSNQAINISNTEADFYGYYLNGYAKPKSKYRASSEQISDVYKYEPKDISLSIHEDRNYSLQTYEQNDIKELKQKPTIKAARDYMFENSRPAIVSPTYKSFALRNYDLPPFMGVSSSNRVYSSPLTNQLSKSILPTPNKQENRPYMVDMASAYSETPITPMTLEPIKSPTQSALISYKSGILTPHHPTNNENSIVRIKRYENSADMAEVNKDAKQELNPSKSYRPVINIIREDGSFSLAKPGQNKKKELLNIVHPAPNRMYDYKPIDGQQSSKYSLFDKIMPRVASFTSNINNLDQMPELTQLKLAGRMNSYGSGTEKKVSEDFTRETKWSVSEVSSPKRTYKEEELFEKVKVLPTLGGKSKFPKEVFSLSLRKRVNP